MKRNKDCKETRNKQILAERRAGLTLEDIGERYNIGKERVRQIVLREERIERYNKWNKRRGSQFNIDDLNHIKRVTEFYRLRNGRELEPFILDYYEKIDSLIEVLSE